MQEAVKTATKNNPILATWVCDCFRKPQFVDWELADHVFYFDSFMEKVLPNYYVDKSKCSFLPLAVNPRRYNPSYLKTPSKTPVFVGNVSGNRKTYLTAIEKQISIEVYGPNSGRFLAGKRKKLSSKMINEIYNNHSLILNINQKPNTEYGSNLRVSSTFFSFFTP